MDEYIKAVGHLKVEVLGGFTKEIIDTWEDPNLIMDLARSTMSELIAGKSTTNPINKFVLGTRGAITGDIFTPKSASTGFVSSRTKLFSEEGSTTTDIEFVLSGNHILSTTTLLDVYEVGDQITITGSAFNNGTFTVSAINSPNDISVTEALSDEAAGAAVTLDLVAYTFTMDFAPPADADSTVTATVGTSTIGVSILDTTVTYIFELPLAEGNDTGIATYTEAAMYTDTDIFSMRTFIGKIKDSSVILRVTWSVTF